MNKKAQAAMEFLMTYGWAILVVIAAIAALAYFGVLDPARLLPERCQSSAGMDCVDKASIGTDTLEVALRNNVGFEISITDVNLTGCSNPQLAIGAGGGYGALGADNVPNNEVFRVSLDSCTNGNPGDKFEGTVDIEYTNTETGLTHVVPVDIRGRVA